MKYFFEEEAIILDSVTNNLELIPAGDKKTAERQHYILAPTCLALFNIREALDRIYNYGAEEAKATAEKYKIALTFALARLSEFEPGHSLAVSDEFVAMAAILSHPEKAHDCVALLKKIMDEWESK